MALSTKAGLFASVADWLVRTDVEQVCADLEVLARATLNRVLRDSRMVASTTLSLGTGKSVACPSDLLDPIYIADNTNEDNALLQVDPGTLAKLRTHRTKSTGTPRFYCMIGRNIHVTPTPATSTTLAIDYYQEIPAMASDGDSNWVLTYFPQVYLYTMLYYAQAYLKDDRRSELFENGLYKNISAAIEKNEAATMETLSGPASVVPAP
jgi:hypothetical protein